MPTRRSRHTLSNSANEWLIRGAWEGSTQYAQMTAEECEHLISLAEKPRLIASYDDHAF